MAPLKLNFEIEPAALTADAIDAAKIAGRSEYRSVGIGMSGAGQECDRALWYALRWVWKAPTFTAKQIRIFERGDLEEGRIYDDLRAAGFEVQDVDPATGRQFRAFLADGWLRGKADGIVHGIPEAPAAAHVLEIKTANAASWRKIAKDGVRLGKPEHWIQTQLYMEALGIDRALYVCTNKDNEERYLERVKHDPEECARVIARVERIVQSDWAPERISDKPSSMACKFCDWREACHQTADVLVWPEPSCRTCRFSTLNRPDHVHCARWGDARGFDAQREGCPAAQLLPDLVPGEQIDADESGTWVTYRMPDGTVFVDGENASYGLEKYNQEAPL